MTSGYYVKLPEGMTCLSSMFRYQASVAELLWLKSLYNEAPKYENYSYQCCF